MGVEEEHRGLGSAIVYNVVKELEGKEITSIGSLVHANKASKCYDNRYIYKRNKYVLLSKNIDNILYFWFFKLIFFYTIYQIDKIIIMINN